MKPEQQITESLNGLHTVMVKKSAELNHRIGRIEKSFHYFQEHQETLGERIVKSSLLQQFKEKRTDYIKFNVTPLELKTAIIGTGLQNDPLTPAMKPGITTGARERLYLRDLMSVSSTDKAAIEYPYELVFNNQAAPQNRENTPFNESGVTFGMKFKPVETIGHFIPVSKQILDDSGSLNTFLQNRMLYGLKLTEDSQILNGNGTNANLDGILNAGNFTPFNRSQSPNNDTFTFMIARAMTQVELSDYSPNGIVLNPEDWENIKISARVEPQGYTILGLPVVVTTAIAVGTFLVGDFMRGTALFDRRQAVIEISYHSGDNFTKNMITILASQRLSLVVPAPLAMVSGTV